MEIIITIAAILAILLAAFLIGTVAASLVLLFMLYMLIRPNPNKRNGLE